MKNENGITMVSLVLYIISFTVIMGMINSIIVFYYNNLIGINSTIEETAEYNKFNLYMLKMTKNGYYLENISNDESEYYIKFSNGEKENKFTLKNEILYYNKIKLCENIKDLNCEEKILENGKKILRTYVRINDKIYTNDYVFEKSENENVIQM